MTRGRAVIVALLAVALAVGVGLWWSLTRAYYREVPAEESVALRTAEGGEARVPVAAFRGIDSGSSPIRYRACFRLDAPPAEALEPYPAADPLTAPGWFDCFDAAAIGAALASGEARAVLGGRDVTYGVDRVVALAGDGRAWAWNQINPCGEAVFNGREPPEGCPPPPEGARLTYSPDE